MMKEWMDVERRRCRVTGMSTSPRAFFVVLVQPFFVVLTFTVRKSTAAGKRIRKSFFYLRAFSSASFSFSLDQLDQLLKHPKVSRPTQVKY
jgi:hypothetical protein